MHARGHRARPPSNGHSHQELVEKILKTFRQYGYEGATMTRFEQVTGLKRSSLYYFFPGGKDEMAEAALTMVERFLESAVIEPLKGVDAKKGLKIAAANLKKYYAGGALGCLLGAFSLGDADRKYRRRVRKCFEMWIDALRVAYEAVGLEKRRAASVAKATVAEIQGSLPIGSCVGSTEFLDSALRRMRDPNNQRSR